MPTAVLGAFLSGVVCLFSATLGQGAVPSLIFAIALGTFVAFAQGALIRLEVNATKRTNWRWQCFVWAGVILGTGIVVFRFTQEWHGLVLPGRWVLVLYFLSVAMVSAGCVIRYYIVPLGVAVNAGYRMGRHQMKVLRRLSNGDERVIGEALRMLRWAVEEEEKQEEPPTTSELQR